MATSANITANLVTASGLVTVSGTTATLMGVNVATGGRGTDGKITTLTAADNSISIAGTATAPTVAVNVIPESQVTNLTTDLAAKATDSAVVHLAGAETITGAKTFSTAPTLSTPLAIGSGGTGSTTQNFMDLTTNQTATGTKTLVVQDKGGQVFNVKAYGAKGDGVTDDTAAIQSALAAVVTALGGTVYFPTGNYLVTSFSFISGNNIHLRGDSLTSSVITASYADPTGLTPPFIVNNKNNIIFENLGFSINGASPAISSRGGDGLFVKECSFAGTTNNSFGMIVLDGQNATASMNNTVIEGCKFTGSSTKGINLYPKTTNLVTNTRIENNLFQGVLGGAIVLNAYAICRNTTIHNNQFVDILNSAPDFQQKTAVFAGIASAYQIFNTVITGNNYYNSVAGGQDGFVYFYQSTDTVIDGNTAIATAGSGPCFAPGRVANPMIGLTITNNTVEGFNAFWDPDAMTHVEVANNVIRNCQGAASLGTGYGVQKFLDIHDNIVYNSWNTTAGVESFVLLGNAAAVSSKIHDNIFIEDTVTRNTKYAIQCTGGSFDFSDVEIYNNKFYMPNNDLEEFLSRQTSTVTYPRRIENNTVVQASGVFNYNQIAGSAYGQTIQKSAIYPGANLTVSAMATPSAPTTAVVGVVGTTNYTYEVVAVNADGTDGVPSPASTAITTGNATLTTANYNTVSWPVVNGAKAYKVLRSVAAAAYQVLTLATGSLADATTSGISIKDQGQYTATAYTPVGSNPGGVFTGSGSGLTNIPESGITNLTTDLAAKATDTSVVHLAGVETITGSKTFSAVPLANAGLDLNYGTPIRLGPGDNNWKIGLYSTPQFTCLINTGYTTQIMTPYSAGQGFAIGVTANSSTLECDYQNNVYIRGNLGVGKVAAYPLDVNGNIASNLVGSGLRVKEGTNAKQGTAVLVAGTATVANTSVTATSRIFLTSQVDGGTPGYLRVSSRTAGTSFVITSGSATDTSTVAYQIFEPA